MTVQHGTTQETDDSTPMTNQVVECVVFRRGHPPRDMPPKKNLVNQRVTMHKHQSKQGRVPHPSLCMSSAMAMAWRSPCTSEPQLCDDMVQPPASARHQQLHVTHNTPSRAFYWSRRWLLSLPRLSTTCVACNTDRAGDENDGSVTVCLLACLLGGKAVDELRSSFRRVDTGGARALMLQHDLADSVEAVVRALRATAGVPADAARQGDEEANTQ